MGPAGGPIRTVVVAGGGIVAWSAAAALRRRLPWLEVTIVATEVPADALADRIACTLPSILGFHADLGLKDEDAILRTGSFYRLGTTFAGWNQELPPYVHCYAEHGHLIGVTAFHHHWLRAAASGARESFDSFSPAVALARAGRIAPPAADVPPPFAGAEPGLRVDPPRYVAMLAAFARHVGVRLVEGEIAQVALREDGYIDRLELADGRAVAGDLFVDCTGPAARLRARLDDEWEDWGHWLPCDRLLLAEYDQHGEPPLLDEVEAVSIGWRWTAATARRRFAGLAYASAHADEERAARLLPGAGAPIHIRAGTRPRSWLRNCVALGDAATMVEPLEWTNLHLAHSGIDRIVFMLPERDCAPVEIADYNRQCTDESTRVRDFLALHYVTSRRPEPFWQAAAAVPPPPTLAHSLALFGERGRLPYYEEETFSRDSWLAVLIGQGVRPRRTDPLVELVPPAEAARAMAGFGAMLARGVGAFPGPSALLQSLEQRSAPR